MKQLFLLEPEDVVQLKAGETLSIHVGAVEVVLGWARLPRAVRAAEDGPATGVICPDCQGTFKNAHGLQTHRARKHKVPGARARFECGWCARLFGGGPALANHIKSAHPGKPYQKAERNPPEKKETAA